MLILDSRFFVCLKWTWNREVELLHVILFIIRISFRNFCALYANLSITSLLILYFLLISSSSLSVVWLLQHQKSCRWGEQSKLESETSFWTDWTIISFSYYWVTFGLTNSVSFLCEAWYSLESTSSPPDRIFMCKKRILIPKNKKAKWLQRDKGRERPQKLREKF